MAKDPPPFSWAEEQEYMERPRTRRETDTDYSVRQSVTSCSATIISSLSRVIKRWDY